MAIRRPAALRRAAPNPRLVNVLTIAAIFMANACGGSSNAVARPSPTPVASAPASSPSPALPVYSVDLTFAGGLAGTVTQAQADANSGCATGKIDVNIVYKGQTWSLDASISGYHGPGSYAAGLGSNFNLMLDSPTFDIWTSTSGSATYTSDTSLTINVVLTNLMAGPGEPGATAHVSGTINCTS